MDNQSTEKIIFKLINKASTKQFVYRNTCDTFSLFKKELVLISEWVRRKTSLIDKTLKAKYLESANFEAELKFASDTLVFIMHTNVFCFPQDHFIYKTAYVKADESRAYCGTIMIYNFLSDSLLYNRQDDTGYLMARIFINKENHFFIQGQRKYSYLFRDFANLKLDKNNIRNIVLTSIQQAMEFDLLVPPFESVNQLTVGQKVQTEGVFALRTGKRLGFTLKSEENNDD